MTVYEKLSHEEREKARHALINWFKSQDIGPADGSFIMISLIADQLTEKSLNLDELQTAIRLNSMVLAIEVADFVRHKKDKVNDE